MILFLHDNSDDHISLYSLYRKRLIISTDAIVFNPKNKGTNQTLRHANLKNMLLLEGKYRSDNNCWDDDPVDLRTI